MARKFLYLVALLIMLVVAGAFAYRIWGEQLMTAAMVPSADYVPLKRLRQNAYESPRMWYARPDIVHDNPALWTPDGVEAGKAGPAAIFFIHPTSYLERESWNAPLDDVETSDRAKLFIQSQASAFNNAGEIWAPRYRQATFGAFLTGKVEAKRALSAAYIDVLSAFGEFLARNPQRPLILAGHSQGALHLVRLLRERVAGTPIASRVVAAYVVGWPISVENDLPDLGMPACGDKAETGCILSWQSFAEPADPAAIQAIYDTSVGFNGKPRKGTHMLCTNPLTGVPGSEAAANLNLGTLIPDEEMSGAALIQAAVPARCDAQGYLLIGDPPELGPYVLPGNNYHVYDYALFWANVRADANERLKSFLTR